MKASKQTLLKTLMAVFMLSFVFTGVKTTLAVKTYYSDTYVSGTKMYQIGVALNENGQEVARYDDDRIKLALPEIDDNDLHLGQKYKEELSVTNCGGNLEDQNSGIDEYVRVIVNKRWLALDEYGNATELPAQDMNLDYIELGYANLGSAWLEDTSVSTPYQKVLYYSKVLKNGETTVPFTSTIRINPAVASKIEVEETTEIVNGKTVYVTTYKYESLRFELYCEVDAVQTHSGPSAVKSAWGVNVNVNADHSLSLN